MNRFFTLFGREFTLDMIEHDTIRTRSVYDDPREQFFAKYASLLADHPDHQKLIRDRKADIRFLDYDWGLNDGKQ